MNQTEYEAFEKAQTKVKDALKNEPLGLTLSQIMTKTKLSHKMVKDVLKVMNVSEFAGDYTLKEHTSPTPMPVQDTTMQTQTSDSYKISFKQQMIDMFNANPKGITLEQALNILNCDRAKFDGTLCGIKKTAFPVELITSDDGRKLYIPQFNVGETQSLPSETTLHEDLPHESDCSSNNIPSNDVEKQELFDCKSLVIKQNFSKSEVYLDRNQLTALLQQLFDLDNVKWKTTGSRVDGVHLSKVEVI